MTDGWDEQVAKLVSMEGEGKGQTDGLQTARQIYPSMLASVEDLPEAQRGRWRWWLLAREALNYFEGDDSGAMEKLKAAADAHGLLPVEDAESLQTELIRVLNALGFCLVNGGEVEQALNTLNRAWEVAHSLPDSHPAQNFVISTLFYLAQIHAQSGSRAQAAFYCGLSFSRQLATPGLTPTSELVNNALGLAQYYVDERQFCQASWLVAIVHSALASDVAEAASLDLMQGNVQRALFSFNLELIGAGSGEADYAAAEATVNALPLAALATKGRPEAEPVRLARDYAALKPLFAAAMSNLEKAKQVFANGQTTDLCETVKAQSELWAATLQGESEAPRMEAITRRRLEVVESLLVELNAAAYPRQYIELSSYAAEAAASLFELLRRKFAADGRAKTAGKMNEIGRKALSYWEVVLDHLRKQEVEDASALQSFANCNYSRGRVLSHLHTLDRQEAKSNLVRALSCYSEVRTRVQLYQRRKGVLEEKLEKQVRMAEEFAELLPQKIAMLK